MIVRTPKELPQFDKDEMLCIDVETTSFDDKVKALEPFKGHRIAGVAIRTMDEKHSWYVPMRHSDNPRDNIRLEIAQRWLKDVVESGRDIVNHNIKFDARFWHFEGCKAKGKLICTQILARLWKSNLLNLSLAYLSGGSKDKRVSAYLKTIKSKNYGRVPVSIMGPYAETDTLETIKLFKKLRKELNSDSIDVWETEIGLTSKLLEAEIHGINVNQLLIKTVYRKAIKRMLILQEEIDKLAGTEIDCNSSDSLYEVLTCKMGFEPFGYTDKGNPQWNKSAFERLEHPIGDKIKEFVHLSHFSSTYCEGWLKRIGDDGRLHTDFRQAAAVTGRMASSDPCFTNVPTEAEMFVIPDEDCVILGGDYSQIEYRLFAHYANDPVIIKKYKTDSNADYHQMLADMLGVPRPFAKSLNFSFLYGMGKTTLLTTIAGIVSMNQDDEHMRQKLRTFGVGTGVAFAKTAKTLNLKEYKQIAEGIYNKYHELIPSCRKLQRRVENVCRARGWLRNYKGRIYVVPAMACYKSVNLLIQGSAADIFKDRLLALLKESPELYMITNVYDSVYFSVHKDQVVQSYIKMKRILEDTDMKVPIIFDALVSRRNWRTCVKVSKTDEIPNALKESETIEPFMGVRSVRAGDFKLFGNTELGMS